MIGKHQICAIITTFNPDESFNERVQRIAAQVSWVVIVNDSGGRTTALDTSKFDNVEIVYNEVNSGIAYALNHGVSVAVKKGFKYFITFDDDTVVDEQYVESVTHFIEKNSTLKFGVIALSREPSTDISARAIDYRVKRTLITSGSFFSLDTFEKINGFNDGLFIDLVDYDFTTKIRKLGLSLIQLKKQGMQHSVGELERKTLLGISFRIYNHSPFRLYYQVRNSFYFLKEFLFFDPALSLLLFSHIFRIAFKAVLFEKAKKQRLHYIGLGIIDGIFNRRGKVRG